MEAHKLGPGRPSVFSYHDYRDFLWDWIEFKFQSEGLSIRGLGKLAGFSSGLLSQILNRKRNLTANAFEKLVPHLGLTKPEIEFFRNLRIISDEKHKDTKKLALKRIQRTKTYQNSHAKEFETYQYLSRWLHIAIREMVIFPGFRWTAEWIHGQLAFKADLREVEQSMKFLEQNDFIKVDEKGKVILAEKNIACRDGVYQLAISDFHKEMLSLATEAVDRFTRESRTQTSYTFALSQKDFAKIAEIINEAREKLKALEKQQKDPNAVYHIGFSAFPLAQGKKSGDSSE